MIISTRLKFARSEKKNELNGLASSEKKDELVGFVYKDSKTGRYKGVRENSKYPKKVCVLLPKLQDGSIFEDTLYQVKLVPMTEEGSDGFVVVEANAILYPAQIECIIIPKVVYKVTVSFGHKTVFFDPLKGNTDKSKTLDGVLEELESRHDLANKDQVIADFKKNAIRLQARMEEDGYNIFTNYTSSATTTDKIKVVYQKKAEITPLIVPKAIYRITIKFGNNTILFDPVEGADHRTKTLKGVLNVINSREDIQDKEQVIRDFRKETNILLNRMDADGYYTTNIRQL